MSKDKVPLRPDLVNYIAPDDDNQQTISTRTLRCASSTDLRQTDTDQTLALPVAKPLEKLAPRSKSESSLDVHSATNTQAAKSSSDSSVNTTSLRCAASSDLRKTDTDQTLALPVAKPLEKLAPRSNSEPFLDVHSEINTPAPKSSSDSSMNTPTYGGYKYTAVKAINRNEGFDATGKQKLPKMQRPLEKSNSFLSLVSSVETTNSMGGI